MPLDEPAWWYGPGEALWVRVLYPLEWLYARQSVRRLTTRQPYRSRLPVICVGNFTAGGTGKTPLTLHLIQRLLEMGETPAILTRGYGGRLGGPHWVDPGKDSARDVGDEPLLLARTAPTLVSRDRRAGAIAIETAAADASVILMDDGLQNPALIKDLTLAVVDAQRGLGNGHVIPAGPLRAPLEVQVPLADAIVLNGRPVGAIMEPQSATHARTAEPATERDAKDAATTRLATLRREFPGPVLAAHAEAKGDLSWLAGRRLIAFAGIANPQRFFSLIERCGGLIAERHTFKDHHGLSDEEARRLIAAATAADAALVTTEKDHVRLKGGGQGVNELARLAHTLPIGLVFENDDGQRIDALLAGALSTGGYRSGLNVRPSMCGEDETSPR